MYFFIVSLPRCRTTWLTNIFLTNYTHCFHEHFSKFEKDAWQSFTNFSKLNQDKMYVGSVDTNPISVQRLIKKLIDYKIAIINRSPDEVAESILKGFDKPHDVEEKTFEAAVYNAIYLFADAMDDIRSIPGVKEFHFDTLGRNEKIVELWNHLIPTFSPDIQRIQELQRMSINVVNDDLNFFLKRIAENLNIPLNKLLVKLAERDFDVIIKAIARL